MAVEHRSPARKAAFRILLAIERGHSHSDDLLRSHAVNALSLADRHLATALVMGVLRWQIALDTQICPLLKRPDAKLDPEVLIALRLGLYQLLHMDRIPAHAAIDESVELARQAGHRFASGMVNAVLRKLAASAAAERRAAADGLAATRAYPEWMVARWTRFFGEDTAREICSHGQAEPPVALHLADASVASELKQAGIALTPGTLLNAARRVVAGDVTTTAAFREGRAWFQDEGSQLVAEIAGTGNDILDCCAAPGGKTLILAERNPHARIVACEASEPRLDQLSKRLATLSDRIECRLADAITLTDESAYDLVLADVPCSGTATLGRNPEIRHRLRAEDFARQSQRQRAILASALRAVRPGGRVLYSTCSLEPEENEEVVAAMSQSRIVPLGPRIDAMQSQGLLADSAAGRLHRILTAEGALRLMPGTFETDGFFVCMLERLAQ